MHQSRSGGWASVVFGAAVILLALPRVGFPEEPRWFGPDEAAQYGQTCGCCDIEKIEKLLDETDKSLKSWKEVLEEAKRAEMSAADAKSRFESNRSRTPCTLDPPDLCGLQVGQTEGLPMLCKPVVLDKVVQKTCDVFWRSILHHEGIHCLTIDVLFLPMVIAVWLNPGRMVAEMEVAAHRHQKAFLEEELKVRKEKCAGLTKYCEGKSEAQQERAREAAGRVGDYCQKACR